MKIIKMLAIVVVTFLAGCAMQPTTHSGAPPTTHTTAQAGTHGYLTGMPLPGSPFSKVRLGMSRQEVESLIGPPTSEDGHITGKQFIPFYFGGDTYRTDWYYRGQGELTFSQSHFGSASEQLIYIRVNTHASGYQK